MVFDRVARLKRSEIDHHIDLRRAVFQFPRLESLGPEDNRAEGESHRRGDLDVVPLSFRETYEILHELTLTLLKPCLTAPLQSWSKAELGPSGRSIV
jgi:hypothetical protein